jgi:hypothetical protein
MNKKNANVRVATRFAVTVFVLSAAMLLTQSVFAADHVTSMQPAKHTVPGSTSASGSMRVTIPFDFIVEGKTLEAGEYYISKNGDNWISIRDAAGSSVMLALTRATSLGIKSTEPKLVFHRYGNKYFLAQSWLRYSSDGREFFESKDERKLAREAREGSNLEAGR